MVVDERSRKELYDSLETTLGSGPADTMMGLLPPVGWADVATKHDIENLRVTTKQDIENLRVMTKQEIDMVRTELEATKQAVISTVTWRVLMMITGMLVGVAGIVVACVVPLYT